METVAAPETAAQAASTEPAEPAEIEPEPEPEPAEPEPTYPRAWRWDKDGPTVDGTFLGFDRVSTSSATAVVCLLRVGDEERTIWLWWEALENQFREELRRRPSRELELGERIVIANRGKKKSEKTGREYYDFRVWFPDRPKLSAAEIFGLDVPAPKPEQAPSEDGNVDNDIPF
jgi:hypothetical protein